MNLRERCEKLLKSELPDNWVDPELIEKLESFARELTEPLEAQIRELKEKLVAVNYRPQKREQFKRRIKDPVEWQKNICRQRTRRAIKSGYLVPQPCEKCGEENSQAHHEDYNKPELIKWLCSKCHAAEHRSDKCKRGHDLTPENLHTNGRGSRGCRTCFNDRARERYAERKKTK